MPFAGEFAGKRLYPLVSVPAADGIPDAVSCRVIKLARESYYRWPANLVTDAEFVEAYRVNTLFDAHADDPEFGYRFLADEAANSGEVMGERTVWRICSTNSWFSRFGKSPLDVRARRRADRSMTTSSSRTSPHPPPTSCDWRISRSIKPGTAAEVSVRSRTCSPTGSRAIRSTRG